MHEQSSPTGHEAMERRPDDVAAEGQEESSGPAVHAMPERQVVDAVERTATVAGPPADEAGPANGRDAEENAARLSPTEFMTPPAGEAATQPPASPDWAVATEQPADTSGTQGLEAWPSSPGADATAPAGAEHREYLSDWSQPMRGEDTPRSAEDTARLSAPSHYEAQQAALVREATDREDGVDAGVEDASPGTSGETPRDEPAFAAPLGALAAGATPDGGAPRAEDATAEVPAAGAAAEQAPRVASLPHDGTTPEVSAEPRLAEPTSVASGPEGSGGDATSTVGAGTVAPAQERTIDTAAPLAAVEETPPPAGDTEPDEPASAAPRREAVTGDATSDSGTALAAAAPEGVTETPPPAATPGAQAEETAPPPGGGTVAAPAASSGEAATEPAPPPRAAPLPQISLADLAEGQVVTGRVKNLAAFGAFVDLGLRERKDGLIHVSQLADRRIGHPSEVVRIGQEVRVRVLGIDREKGRISLTLRDADEPQDAPSSYRAVPAEEPPAPQGESTLQSLMERFGRQTPQPSAAPQRDSRRADRERREREEILRRMRGE